MSELVFLLEEESARAMLQGLLPRLVPAGVGWRCIVFEGKQDLEAQMVRRIRGYRVPDARFVVLRDKDSADCHATKSRLLEKCQLADCNTALVRIACHEMESWFLGDLQAVEKAYNIGRLSRRQQQRKYRNPDGLNNAAQELRRLVPTYQKISGARTIGQHMDINNNCSVSFRVFIEGVYKAIG